MGPIILWGIFSLPENWFAISAVVLVTIGAWEWSALTGLSTTFQRSMFVLLNLFFFVTVLFLQNTNINLAIILTSLVWWMISIPLLLNFPFKDKNILHVKLVKGVVGIILLLATMVSMILIRSNPQFGPEFILYAILLIWFADSGAYFAGRALGKNKLLPNVSPGKTWEGVAGAILITLITSLVALNILNISSSHTIPFIFVTLVTVVYSIVGDLSESMFKRMSHIKDSGHLLPGHGGILDRIDSLMSALPVFFAGLWLMEKMV
jgi:phosphatidate cytidylyltransferase